MHSFFKKGRKTRSGGLKLCKIIHRRNPVTLVLRSVTDKNAVSSDDDNFDKLMNE